MLPPAPWAKTKTTPWSAPPVAGSNTAEVSSPPTGTRHSPRVGCRSRSDMNSNLSSARDSRDSCAPRNIMRRSFLKVFLLGAAAVAAACGSPARVPVSAETGVHPEIPRPKESLIPVINVVKAKRWTNDATPVAGEGLAVRAFARELNHPRWLYVLPNGDVLVAETNAPKRPDDGKGIKGFFFRIFQRKAGGAVPSQNRIILLRDRDGDGVAKTRTVFLSGLHSPFGMALVGDALYVANTDGIVRFPYSRGETHISAPGRNIVALPAGRINHHWTKNVIASTDGSKLYASVGSNSNDGESGIGKEEGRAAIWEVDPATAAHRVFASG